MTILLFLFPDGQPENIMPPAPKGGGITNEFGYDTSMALGKTAVSPFIMHWR